MITKTLSGIPLLDEPYGGVFSNRGVLVSGAKETGKTVMGLQFIRQGLEQSDRCLYLSTMVADDLGILGESLGFKLSYYIESEALTLLEYESFITGSSTPGMDMLPPEGFDQLRDIIHTNSIERIVLDTVLPWVSVRDPDRMSQQVFSFIRSLDRLGVTSMLTLPKPVSTLAFKLKKAVEDVVPVSILLQGSIDSHPATFQVVKYLGEQRLGGKVPYHIQQGIGICERPEGDTVETKPSSRSSGSGAQNAPNVRPDEKRPRFSSVTFERSTPRNQPSRNQSNQPMKDHGAPPSPASDPKNSFIPQEAGPAESKKAGGDSKESPSSTETEKGTPSSTKQKGARLSEIWKPQPDSGSPHHSAE